MMKFQSLGQLTKNHITCVCSHLILFTFLHKCICIGYTHMLGYNFPLLFHLSVCGLPRWHSGKESACQCRRYRRLGFQSLCQEYPLEKGMATHSSILPCKIPWAEKPGWLQSMGVTKSQTQLSN